MFLEISSRHLTLKDYFELAKKYRRELWIELESCKGNRIPGWKKFSSYIRHQIDKTIFSQKEIDRIDTCCLPLSERIIEIMKTRGATINHLERAIKSKCSTRKDLLSCIKKLKKIKKGNPLLEEYGLLELDQLKVALTNKYREDDWEVICREVCALTGNGEINLIIIELENYKQKRMEIEASPCEVFFDMLCERKPDLSLLNIYNALDSVKQKRAAKIFIKNIATLLHEMSQRWLDGPC